MKGQWCFLIHCPFLLHRYPMLIGITFPCICSRVTLPNDIRLRCPISPPGVIRRQCSILFGNPILGYRKETDHQHNQSPSQSKYGSVISILVTRHQSTSAMHYSSDPCHTNHSSKEHRATGLGAFFMLKPLTNLESLCLCLSRFSYALPISKYSTILSYCIFFLGCL